MFLACTFLYVLFSFAVAADYLQEKGVMSWIHVHSSLPNCQLQPQDKPSLWPEYRPL